MPSPFLGLNGLSPGTGTPQVRRFTGLSGSVVGNSFSSEQTITISANSQPLNRVIQFGSQNTFVALINNSIFYSADAGTSWLSVFTFPGVTNVSGVADSKTGLNVVYVNGLPTICFVSGLNNFGQLQGYYSTDGISWVTDSATNIAANFCYSNDTIYRNALYACVPGDSVSTVIAYAPGSPAALINTPANEGSTTGSLCVFNDQLMYTSITQTPATTRIVYILSGGTWQNFATLATPGAITSTGKSGMFVDSNSGDLIVFNRKSVPGAWGCWSVTSAGVVTDISSTVLPASMLASASSASRVLTFVDGQASPGTNPDKYVIYSDSNVTGSLQTLYKWNGVATRMLDIDTGGSIRTAYTISNNCQGVGSWTSGENSVNLLSRTPISGGIRTYFKLYSSSGLSTVSVRALFGTGSQEYPLTLGTITANSHGSISSNVNTGLTADNGITTYYFTWNSITDGIPAGDRFRLILEVSV